MQPSRLSATALAVAVVVALTTVASSNDETTHPGAKGAGVVEAVLNRISASCIFSDDKLFMRRLAYVESADGADPDTFRPGYYGGIWQVDKAMFDVTQSSSSNVVMLQFIKDIQKAFGIDWPSVAWDELTKPLHSALGARLYIQYQSRSDPKGIPRNITDQSQFWKKYYRPAGDAAAFVSAAERLENGCQNPIGADIIFVLDGSGSIGSSNFVSIKKFVKDVVNGFDVGPTQTQFGVIKFSTAVKREFDLNRYTTKSAVLSAVDKIVYEAGGTNTHLALDELRVNGFAEKNGARPKASGHPRVAIVLTDGQSNVPKSTITAALRVHDADITVFAIGVGSTVDRNELEVIASEPVCLHLFLLSGFSEIEGLKSSIEKRTCDAPIIISPSQNSTTGGRLPPGGDQNCKIKVPVGGTTIQLSTDGGHSTFYTSKSTYPSSDFYEQKAVSQPGRPGVLFIPQPPTQDAEGLIFCNIKGDNNSATNISIGTKPGDQDRCKHHDCQNGGTCFHTETSYGCECKPGFGGLRCEIDVDECESYPCLNGGTCDNLINGWTCECLPGWTGENCGTDTDECESNPCINGLCEDGQNSYKCNCLPGFGGTNCQNEINACLSNPCQHGICVRDVDGYRCDCEEEWTGTNCDSPIDHCTPNVCNQGVCISRPGKYDCVCNPGFTGSNCDQPIDRCEPNPCQHGSCLNDGVGGYRCECYAGYTGDDCETGLYAP